MDEELELKLGHVKKLREQPSAPYHPMVGSKQVHTRYMDMYDL